MDIAEFFNHTRAGVMGPRLSVDEVVGSEAVINATKGLPISYVAYALATAWHETAHTMQPIKEYGGEEYFFRMYDINGHRPYKAKELGNLYPGEGAKYCGRGYVQLTGKNNYKKAGDILQRDLVNNPDLAMDPEIAAEILRQGMVDGWFTGKSFSSYLPGCKPAARISFQKARRIINGTDDAKLIADYAMSFQEALLLSNY